MLLHRSRAGETAPTVPSSGFHRRRFLRASLPAGAQRLLLLAAVAPLEVAADAWRRWIAAVDFERLDAASLQMLPDVFGNLRHVDPGAIPEYGRLKGVYRHTWARNRIALRDTVSLVRCLEDGGVPVIVFGGPGRAARYPRLAARPIDELEIVVRRTQADRALGWLADRGWRPRYAPSTAVRPRCMHLVDRSGQVCIVHWCLLGHDDDVDAENGMWASATEVNVADASLRVLDPEHELVMSIASGVQWRPFPLPRWVADVAAVVADTTSTLDWERVAMLSHRFEATMRVRIGLAFVRDELGLPIPPAALASLARQKPTWRERVELQVLCRSPHGPLRGLPRRWIRWWSLTRHRGWLARLGGFPSFLATELGCAGYGELLLRVVNDGLHRRVRDREHAP